MITVVLILLSIIMSSAWFSLAITPHLPVEREQREGVNSTISKPKAPAIKNVDKKRKSRELLNLPRVQFSPTPEGPFVFLHMEKTTGTTIRHYLYESAQKLSLSSHIACYDTNTSCLSFSLSSYQVEYLRGVSIIAGHFQWGVWQALPSFQKKRPHEEGEDEEAGLVGADSSASSFPSLATTTGAAAAVALDASSSSKCTASDPTAAAAATSASCTPSSEIINHGRNADVPPPPSCLVFGRHPVHRIKAYYYERCFYVRGCLGYLRFINDLSVDELRDVMLRYRHSLPASHALFGRVRVVIDDGMRDAACRALTAEAETTRGVLLPPEGIYDKEEKEEEKRHGHKDEPYSITAGAMAENIPADLSASEVDEALGNINHCVVGLVERLVESRDIVRDWFPWFDLGNNTIFRTFLLMGDDREKALYIRTELEDLIMALNPCDMRLYTKMEQIFEKQLLVLREDQEEI